MIRYKKYQMTGENSPLKASGMRVPSSKRRMTPNAWQSTWQTTTPPTPPVSSRVSLPT